jgi:hypothetical protein
MNLRSIAVAMMLLASPALATEIPTEEQKVEALKCAFTLSRLGWGTLIDMTNQTNVEACAMVRANAAVSLPPFDRLPPAKAAAQPPRKK